MAIFGVFALIGEAAGIAALQDTEQVGAPSCVACQRSGSATRAAAEARCPQSVRAGANDIAHIAQARCLINMQLALPQGVHPEALPEAVQAWLMQTFLCSWGMSCCWVYLIPRLAGL